MKGFIKKKEGRLALFLGVAKVYRCMKPEVGDIPEAVIAEVPVLILAVCSGPSPSLMMARESGINFVCQPLSS